MNKIKSVLITIKFSHNFEKIDSHTLRGAISACFPDEPLFHQHGKDGIIYRYPLIQYRCYKNEYMIVGFNEGADTLMRLKFMDSSINIFNTNTMITEAVIKAIEEPLEESDKMVRYRFISPWLPLNQDLFARYKSMNEIEKKEELDRLAVANLLMMMKGLSLRTNSRIFASFELKNNKLCRYKDNKMEGFLGELSTNLLLPENIAIGRAVSHGYGWLKRI